MKSVTILDFFRWILFSTDIRQLKQRCWQQHLPIRYYTFIRNQNEVSWKLWKHSSQRRGAAEGSTVYCTVACSGSDRISPGGEERFMRHYTPCTIHYTVHHTVLVAVNSRRSTWRLKVDEGDSSSALMCAVCGVLWLLWTYRFCTVQYVHWEAPRVFDVVILSCLA